MMSEEIKRPQAKKKRPYDAYGMRALVLVDGIVYRSESALLRAAKERGFEGSMASLRARLKKGADTWAILSPRCVRSGGKEARKIRKQKQLDECAKAMARIDARKKEIADL